MHHLLMTCVCVFFFASSLSAQKTIPELIIELNKVSKNIADVSEECGDISYPVPFQELSLALQLLETEKTTADNLVSSFKLVNKGLDVLALNIHYMSHWVAFGRLQDELKKILKAHGVAYEEFLDSLDASHGIEFASCVKPIGMRSYSSESYSSGCGLHSPQSFIESVGFDLELFMEQFEWFYEQIAGLLSFVLTDDQLQPLFDVLDLAKNKTFLDLVFCDGEKDELQHQCADVMEKKRMICSVLRKIPPLLTSKDLTPGQRESLEQIEQFALFLNKKIVLILDCAQEHI